MALDWKSLFSSAGRSGRKSYWKVFGAALVIQILLQIVREVIGDNPVILLIVPAVIALVVININNNTKRLHDVGRSGWWQLAPVPICVAAGVPVILVGADNPAAQIVSVLGLYGVLIAFWVALGSIRGDMGENRFGPPPGSATAVEAVA
jgi:uncharacterized membrane protein YhaH (DUF805 family)